ncbi:MAG: phosphatidylserine decarboxylase [Geodermatophilaceae bacterium]
MRRLRLDRAGWPFIASFAVPAALLAARGHRRWAVPFAALAGYLGLFFRDPDRSCDVPMPDVLASDPDAAPDPDAVLAPADGVVVVAGDPEPGVPPAGHWRQVSIFLSPVDVHVNRSPYGGRVTRTTYRPGRFLAAFTDAAAAENERTEIWLDAAAGRTIVFRQVVGFLARRIVLRVSAGDQLHAGQRIGLMKFGSRMDVFVPRDCTVVVNRGDRVRGGESVIARW